MVWLRRALDEFFIFLVFQNYLTVLYKGLAIAQLLLLYSRAVLTQFLYKNPNSTAKVPLHNLSPKCPSRIHAREYFSKTGTELYYWPVLLARKPIFQLILLAPLSP